MSGQLVVFSLSGEEYALPITQVQEIIRFIEPRAVSSDSPWIRGVISLRGKIVPVCDLAARLRLAVLTVDDSQLEALPTAGAAFIEAIAKIDHRLVVLLNADGIFAGLEPGLELERAA